MQKNPFVILGVDESVTQNELYDAYKKKRSPWEERRFALGADGSEACEKIDMYDEAYREAKEILDERILIAEAKTLDFSDVDALLRERRYDEARRLLETRYSIKTAEWHFLMSVVLVSEKKYYDAREELRSAVHIEPSNEKYVAALKNIEEKMNGGQRRESAYTNDNGGRSYVNSDEYRNGTHRGCSPCEVCQALYCADCCCECMGGDLISCC